MLETTLRAKSAVLETKRTLEHSTSIRRLHWGIVAGSFLLTFAAWDYSSSTAQEKRKMHFDREADVVLGLIGERMSKYEEALWAGVALIDSLEGDLDHDTWRAYCNSIRIGEKYPGINGIGVIHALEPHEVESFVQLHQQDRPDFTIFPQHERAERLPITFIEPAQQNAKAIGLDIAHEPNRHAAARRAMESGSTQITGPIILVQDEGRTPGFLFYAPFYEGVRRAQPSSNCAGMVYATFIVDELMEGVLAHENRHIGLRISDGEHALFDELNAGAADLDPDPLFRVTRSVPMHGRDWRFEIESSKSFRAAHHTRLPAMVLVAGLLIDGLLLGVFFLLSNANRRALQFADQATAELQAKATLLEESNQNLEHFAYVASHDLQEPLRMVSSFAELLGSEYQSRFDAQGERWLGYMIDGASRMQTLVQGLLEYSRVGRRAGKPTSINLDRVLDNVLRDLSQAIQESGSELTRDPMPDVHGDSDQLAQVLQNLVSNAIKFRKPDGESKVHLGCKMDGDRVIVSVSDNGIGIDPVDAEKVFVIFERLHARSDYPGSGLGLAIAKKVVDGMGGRLWFEPSEPYGTTFFMDLPLSSPGAYVLPTAHQHSQMNATA